MFKKHPRSVNNFRTAHLGGYLWDFWSPYVAEASLPFERHARQSDFVVEQIGESRFLVFDACALFFMSVCLADCCTQPTIPGGWNGLPERENYNA